GGDMPNLDRNGGTDFERAPLPPRFCNLDRLLHALEARDLDGIVVTSPQNVFYLSGFNGVAHKSDEPRPYAVVLSRHAPESPILVIMDCYVGTFLAQPSWIEDLRPLRGVMAGHGGAPKPEDIDRFIPKAGAGLDWVERGRGNYAYDMASALQSAMKDLGLDRGGVAFDDMGFGVRYGPEAITIADGYDPMMYARAVKTDTELALMARATQLNQTAIERTVAGWERGMSWRDLNRAYARVAVELGGFVRDPGGMVLGHLCGGDRAITLQTGLEDFDIEPGMNVMFDCHGTLDLYCWDGGKSWIVGGAPEGEAKRRAQATAEVGQTVLAAVRPGVRVSALETTGREVYRKAGLPDADAAAIFFHGLGLSHMDLEQTTADGEPNGDWMLEEGMVVPIHLLYPGGERDRSWLEEVAVVTADGGRPLFTWGFEPLMGGGG
ncbi:MAG: M24 family metallopeptidase, partial [Kiloniellales bacterium]|nr:M24 family metallopeptidase [Kiloniellales bacterium]